MAITINGKVYRNLEEQVQKNKEDIESIGYGDKVTWQVKEGVVIDEYVSQVEIGGNSKFVFLHIQTEAIATSGTYTIGYLTGVSVKKHINCYFGNTDKGFIILQPESDGRVAVKILITGSGVGQSFDLNTIYTEEIFDY